MPKNTSNLSLYEFDPASDDRSSTAFNIQTFLNENWDKIDTFAGETNEKLKSFEKVDDALSESSTNPVQNKVIKLALDSKAESTHSHDVATTSTAGFMSASDKQKLDNLETTISNKIADAIGSAIGGEY